MLHRIERMLIKRAPEFVIIFFGQSSVIFINYTWFLVNAIGLTILCALYPVLVEFVIPTLPTWYARKFGDIPKFDTVQAVLCFTYCLSAWAPILWMIN